MKKDRESSPPGTVREPILPRPTNNLFTDAEQNQLHSFLDVFDEIGVPEGQPANNNQSTYELPPSKRSHLKTSAEASSDNSAPYDPADRGDERSPRKRGRTESSGEDGRKSRALGDSPRPRGGGRGRKPSHELLTEEQKKANHIASEQKRRANIRIGFDKLVDIVPTLSQGHRSESQILQKSADYIRQLLDTKNSLSERVRELQTALGDVPDEDSSDGEMDS